MNEARSALYRRGALALSSVAVTTAMWLGAVPPAWADPYDDGDAPEIVDDSGSYAEPVEEPGPVDAGEPVAEAPEPEAPAPDLEEPAPGAPDEPGPAGAPDEPGPVEAPDEPGPAGAPDEPGPAGAPDEPGPGDAPGDPGTPGDPGDPGDPDTNIADPAVEADTADPDIAEVSQEDFDEAHGADAVDVDPPTATETEVTELTESLESFTSTTTSTTSSTWSSPVTQWNSRWTGYDRWFRPVFTNPYKTPLQIIYPYNNTTRVFDVPPSGRAVLTAPGPGVYSFTAVNRDPSGKPVTVSTGSFSGGGYRPAPGQPPPPKPKPPTTFKNVLVALKYKDGESKPFRVKTLADLGDDPSVGGHRVLLDEETPAWGHWTKTGGGERLFEITSTQQLPGLVQPSQGPLPGYQVQLSSSETAAPAQDTWVKPVAIAAAVAGVLAIGAVLYFLLSGRRRKTAP
ncbi:collagen-like protein [Mycolicibacterium novocastrense]|uniref:Collagen-like protein n=1 Tax=Mycolicibacterium novocastrense TaxID=59813 RepID=A0AAW5SG29_MYCNV|nr:collagen-like protein [Mycolicibacterium novocastrense]MCV7023189.1 collagen-like protein [Mycolicibacterium novocastrense]GAT10714.1 uncharacterized protein RMCN_3847 [Mycolicibacterium novocastrense]